MVAPHLSRENFRFLLYRSSCPNFYQERDGYFLFFMFRIDTIKLATAMIIINSSYVLIITTPFVRPPKQVGAAPSQLPG